MTAEDHPKEPDPVELPIDGTLDLHLFAPRDVPELVGDYLDECRLRGILHVRIVHGKGIGVLRETVHAVLARRDDVVSFRLDSETGSGWGATLVELRG
jgi:DNA-nicking Smr family endonuclease